MRLIHVSDLHLGRRLHEVSLIEDQAYILNQIVAQCSALQADVLLVSGDVYDKNSPSEQSFELWSDFMDKVSKLDMKTLVISGNHDSQERLGVGANLIKEQGIYIASKYQGYLETLIIEKDQLKVQFLLLPFVRPAEVRNHHEDLQANTYNDAIAHILKDFDYGQGHHNVLLSHQFVTDGSKPPLLSDSEVGPMVGGIDAINASLFDGFDYVALGHIHKPQAIRNETIRYSGSPLKYSISEAKDDKALVIIDLFENDIKLTYEPLIPLRDVKVIKGKLEELISAAPIEKSQDLIYALITNNEALMDPMIKLQNVYPNAVGLELRPEKSNKEKQDLRSQEILQQNPMELVQDFYQSMLGKDMDEESEAILVNIINSTEGEES